MVLDVMNMTNQEVEVKYTENKSILIEEGESCRVPIPVERCPLSKIGQVCWFCFLFWFGYRE